MNSLFRHGPYFKVITRDCRNCGFLEEKELEVEEDDGTITRYLITADADTNDTDGASIPALASAISHLIGLGIDPYGDYWPGAATHDRIFRRKLLQWINNQWAKLTYVDSGADPKLGQMDFDRANAIFKALMFGLGTDPLKAKVIYEALALFGRTAWDEDANAAAQAQPGSP